MTAIATALMCVRAMGLSPTFRQSTPASFSSAAPSRIGRKFRPRDGSTSTVTTKRPAASFSRSVDGSGPDAGSRSMTIGRGPRGRRGGRCRGLAGQRLVHRGDVLGRRAAAAADDRRPGLDESHRVLAERLRRAGIDYRLLADLRLAGVRLCRKLRRLRGRELLDDVQRELRARHAVDADDVRAQIAQNERNLARLFAGPGAAVALERKLNDHGQVAALADGPQRLLRLGERGKRLDGNQVDARVDERLRLLVECEVRFLEGHALAAGKADVERAHRAGDEDGPRGLRLRLTGDFDRAPVYLLQPVRRARMPPAGALLAPNVFVSMTSAPASM